MFSLFKRKYYGYKPSPYDKRDYNASKCIPVLGSASLEFDLVLPILEADYQIQNDCTCQVRATIKTQQELKERGRLERYDPNMLFCARQPGQYMGKDGCIGREVNDNLRKFGISRRGLFTGTFKGQLMSIPQNVLDDAKYQLIRDYYRIYTKQEMRSALIYNGGFSIAIPLFQSFFDIKYSPNELPILSLPKKGEIAKYGHDVACQGLLTNDVLFCLNSHGSQFGMNGYFGIPLGYPIYEMWGFTDEHTPPPNILTEDVVLWIDKKEYLLKNNQYQMDVAPFIDPLSNRTFVPLRFIGEASGFMVKWDAEKQEVYLTNGINWIRMTIGNNVWYDNGEIKVINDRNEFPRIVNNRTFIPLRIVMESKALNRKVEWYADTQKIVIKKA